MSERSQVAAPRRHGDHPLGGLAGRNRGRMDAPGRSHLRPQPDWRRLRCGGQCAWPAGTSSGTGSGDGRTAGWWCKVVAVIPAAVITRPQAIQKARW